MTFFHCKKQFGAVPNLNNFAKQSCITCKIFMCIQYFAAIYKWSQRCTEPQGD